MGGHILSTVESPGKGLCRHPLTRWAESPIWLAAQQALPRARPSTVADVHNHAVDAARPSYRICDPREWTTCVIPPRFGRGPLACLPDLFDMWVIGLLPTV